MEKNDETGDNAPIGQSAARRHLHLIYLYSTILNKRKMSYFLL